MVLCYIPENHNSFILKAGWIALCEVCVPRKVIFVVPSCVCDSRYLFDGYELNKRGWIFGAMVGFSSSVPRSVTDQEVIQPRVQRRQGGYSPGIEDDKGMSLVADLVEHQYRMCGVMRPLHRHYLMLA